MKMRFLLAASNLVIAFGASAQASAPTSAPIVVEGRAISTGDVSAALSAMAHGTSDQQSLARFDAPVCIAVSGFSPAVGRLLADRIIDDASAAGVPLAGARCRPNVHIKSLFADSSGYVAVRARLGRSLAGNDAVLVVSGRTDRSREGDLIDPQGAQILGTPVATLKISRASHIGVSSRQQLDGTLIIFRSDALIGKTVTQIADYAAMRALADVAPPEKSRVATILTLFEADHTPPDALTKLDRSYLRALYAGPGNRSSAVQLHEIRNEFFRK